MRRFSGSGFPWRSARLAALYAVALVSTALAIPGAPAAEGLSPIQQQALDIYRELVEINTVTATGDTAKAAEAMAARLRAGRLCGRRRSRFLAGPAQGQSRRAAARKRRAQADPAARSYRRGAGQARGLVNRSIQAGRAGRLFLRARQFRTTNTWRRPLSPI